MEVESGRETGWRLRRVEVYDGDGAGRGIG